MQIEIERKVNKNNIIEIKLKYLQYGGDFF